MMMTFTIIGFLLVADPEPKVIDTLEQTVDTLELCMEGVQAILELPVKEPQSMQAYCAVRMAPGVKA